MGLFFGKAFFGICLLSSLLVISADPHSFSLGEQAFAETLPQASRKLAPKLIVEAYETGGISVKVDQMVSSATRLTIQRNADGKRFVTIKVFRDTKKAIDFIDDFSSSDSVSYRARFTFSSGIVSAWSDQVGVTPDDGNNSSGPSPTPDAPISCAPVFIARAVELANRARGEIGASPLVTNAQLSKSAQVHSVAMAKANVLSHDKWLQEIYAVGYEGSGMGQNVASFYSSPESVMTAWINSPAHVQNLYSPQWTETGVGCATDSTGAMWWTENFGSR